MDKAEENIRPKPSGRYKADLTVAAVTFLGLWFTFLVAYWFSMVVSHIALIAGIIVFVCRKLYSNDLSKPWRIVTGVIRGVLYAVALSALALPFFMKVQSPFLYPVQKSVYSFNFADRGESVLYFLPDSIPEDASKYKIKMFPGVLQAEPYIQIEFSTSSGQLEEYRSFAQSCRAVKVETSKGWQEYLNEKAGREQTVEAWQFPVPTGGRYHATYYICLESGYFLIVW
ncbi:MAG: hypothetical protein K2N72_06090 [Oscillospiraceae bacterium]|nr:hypothetical protein [Oscillospiraceae bacterium]